MLAGQTDTRAATRPQAPRDAFAPGLLFPLAFACMYAAPYLNLVDYSDVMTPPGLRMAAMAALGLTSYLWGLRLARALWPTSDLPWPRIDDTAWRAVWVVALLATLALASLAILAFTFRMGAMIPLLESNKEAARFAFTARLGHAVNALTRVPITTAIACGLFVLISRRMVTPATVVAGSLVLISAAAEAQLGHRGLPIFILAPLAVCFHYLVRPFRLGFLVACAALAVLALGIANYIRLTSSPPQLAHLLAHSNLPSWMPVWLTPAVTFVAFSPLTFNLVLTKVPSSEPFQYGMAIVNGAFGILPGHQATISEFVTRRLLNQPEGSPGLPPTILGGFYLDFGVAGIAIGMLLVGALSQYLYWRVFARSSVWSVFFYAFWTFNLLVALYGDFIANDLIWFIPLSVYCIDVAVRLTARLTGTRVVVAHAR